MLNFKAGARLRGVGKPYNRVCCYIDGWNLPEASEFKLEPVEKENTLALLETVKQYRLRPTEEYPPLQVCLRWKRPTFQRNALDGYL